MQPAEPVTTTPPRSVPHAMLTQRWRDVAFVHWAVEPAAVAGLMPPGVRPDVLDGRSFVGLVALRMEGTAVLGGPRLPYLGSFVETNVRLYSVDEQGRRGVVFLSMDASRLLPALAGRWLVRLPYRWSRMRAGSAGPDGWLYSTRRRGLRAVQRSAMLVRPAEPIDNPSALDCFLTARWGLHAGTRRGCRYLPNEHEPWPLYRAELVYVRDDLVASVGAGTAEEEPVSVLWSPGVGQVRLGIPQPARARAS